MSKRHLTAATIGPSVVNASSVVMLISTKDDQT